MTISFECMLLSSLTAFLVVGCKKSSSSDPAAPVEDATIETTTNTGTNTDNGNTPAGALQLSGFNAIVPRDLAVTSVTETMSADALHAGAIVIQGLWLGQPAAGGHANDFYSKKKRLQDTMKATAPADCMGAVPTSFNLQQGGLGSTQCWGVEISTAVHPDAPQPSPWTSSDSGFQWDYPASTQTSGEACATRMTNSLMGAAGDYADTALGFQAMIACAARLAGKAMPEVGADPVSMIDTLSGIDMASHDFNIATATMEKTTASDGKTVYVTRMEGWINDVARSLKRDFSLVVRHKVLDDDNTGYHGIFQYYIKNFDNVTGKDMAMSLLYSWEDDRLNYRYRQVNPPADATDHFDATTNEIKTSLCGSSLNEIVVDVDGNGIGKLSYVWDTNDNMVFNVETTKTGAGLAFFGQNDSQVNHCGTEDFYKIQGLRCYIMNPVPPGSEKYSANVQRQTLKLGAD